MDKTKINNWKHNIETYYKEELKELKKEYGTDGIEKLSEMIYQNEERLSNAKNELMFLGAYLEGFREAMRQVRKFTIKPE